MIEKFKNFISVGSFLSSLVFGLAFLSPMGNASTGFGINMTEGLRVGSPLIPPSLPYVPPPVLPVPQPPLSYAAVGGAEPVLPPALSSANLRLLTYTDLFLVATTVTLGPLIKDGLSYGCSSVWACINPKLSRWCANCLYRCSSISSYDMRIDDLFRAPLPNQRFRVLLKKWSTAPRQDPRFRFLLKNWDRALTEIGVEKYPVVSRRTFEPEEGRELLVGYWYTLKRKDIPAVSIVIVRDCLDDSPEQVFWPLRSSLSHQAVRVESITKLAGKQFSVRVLRYDFTRGTASVIRPEASPFSEELSSSTSAAHPTNETALRVYSLVEPLSPRGGGSSSAVEVPHSDGEADVAVAVSPRSSAPAVVTSLSSAGAPFLHGEAETVASSPHSILVGAVSVRVSPTDTPSPIGLPLSLTTAARGVGEPSRSLSPAGHLPPASGEVQATLGSFLAATTADPEGARPSSSSANAGAPPGEATTEPPRSSSVVAASGTSIEAAAAAARPLPTAATLSQEAVGEPSTAAASLEGRTLPAVVDRDENWTEAHLKLKQFCQSLSEIFPQRNLKDLLGYTLLKEWMYPDEDNILKLNAEGWLACLTLTAPLSQAGSIPEARQVKLRFYFINHQKQDQVSPLEEIDDE